MKLVLLDRDGVINHDSKDYIKNAEEWQVIDGVAEAISTINHANTKCVVVSNQSGIARELFSLEDMMLIQRKMKTALSESNAKIDGILFCPHGPDDDCDCRKPKPALLLEALERFGIEAKDAVFIGDSLRDIQAAQKADIKAILVRTGNGAETEKEWRSVLKNVDIYDSLTDFVKQYKN